MPDGQVCGVWVWTLGLGVIMSPCCHLDCLSLPNAGPVKTGPGPFDRLCALRLAMALLFTCKSFFHSQSLPCMSAGACFCHTECSCSSVTPLTAVASISRACPPARAASAYAASDVWNSLCILDEAFFHLTAGCPQAILCQAQPGLVAQSQVWKLQPLKPCHHVWREAGGAGQHSGTTLCHWLDCRSSGAGQSCMAGQRAT